MTGPWRQQTRLLKDALTALNKWDFPKISIGLKGSFKGFYRVLGFWDFPNVRVPYFGVLKKGSYDLGCYIRAPYFRKPPSLKLTTLL